MHLLQHLPRGRRQIQRQRLRHVVKAEIVELPVPREVVVADYDATNQVIEKIQRLHERWGFSYFSVPSANLREFAPVIAKLS